MSKMAPIIEQLSVTDRTTLAALALATNDGKIDLAEAARLAGSNTTNAMRERVRRARVHFEELSTAVGGASEGGGASSTSAGSGSKKRPSLSKPSARPAKKAAISVDKDLVVTAKSVESDDVDDLV